MNLLKRINSIPLNKFANISFSSKKQIKLNGLLFYSSKKHFARSQREYPKNEMDDEEKFNNIFKQYNAIFKLKNRNIVSVSGEDGEIFLQNMVTNDMKQLTNDKVAISALFLSPKGRVKFDSIIVKSHL
jgi:hypothetical protein